ncbi:MAG: DUF2780 domain-containing protein [Bradymonadia bacterium]
MIDGFISEAASKFGIDPSTARSLTGGLLKAVKGEAPEEDFNAVADQVPGMAELANEDAEESGGGGGGLLGGLGGGGLGGLMGAATSVLGGEGGGITQLMTLFSSSGLGADQAGGFVQMLVGFLKNKVGDDLVQKLVSKVPMLGQFLG